MKLFTYRGIRVRAFYRHIQGITWFIWWFPSLLVIGNYCYVNLEEFAEEQDLKMATLRKIIYLLQEQGIVFERTESAILVDPFQEELLLESLIHFEEGRRKSYPKPLKRRLVIMG